MFPVDSRTSHWKGTGKRRQGLKDDPQTNKRKVRGGESRARGPLRQTWNRGSQLDGELSEVRGKEQESWGFAGKGERG